MLSFHDDSALGAILALWNENLLDLLVFHTIATTATMMTTPPRTATRIIHHVLDELQPEEFTESRATKTNLPEVGAESCERFPSAVLHPGGEVT